MSSVTHISTAAARETDESKRIDLFVEAVQGLSQEWHNADEWKVRRLANKVVARQEFEEMHSAFAKRYAKMFNKIVSEARPFDTREIETLRKGAELKRQSLGSESPVAENDTKTAFNQYALDKYNKEFKLIEPLITEHRATIESNLRSFMFLRLDAQKQPSVHIHEAKDLAAHPILKTDEKFKTYVRTCDRTQAYPVYLWYSDRRWGFGMLYKLPWLEAVAGAKVK